MIPSMVTHHPKLLKSDKTLQLQLNKEFDTSTAQLVKLVIIGSVLAPVNHFIQGVELEGADIIPVVELPSGSPCRMSPLCAHVLVEMQTWL